MEEAEGKWRIIHDGTHYVLVNVAIVIKDHVGTPLCEDMQVIDEELEERREGYVGVIWDFETAHRTVKVIEADWGYQACMLDSEREKPEDEAQIDINTSQTYGIGSASYWYGRYATMVIRSAHYVLG